MPAPAEPRRRRRRRLWGVLAILLVLGLGVGYGAVAYQGPPVPRPGGPPASDLSEHTAVLHVHSSYSHEHPRLGWSHSVPETDGLEVIDVFGQLMAVPFGRKVMLPGPGVYRVEVDRRVDLFPSCGVAYRPWIFSNPVRVRG